MGEVRSRSGQWSKSCAIRLQTVETSKEAFFAQNFPCLCTANDREKVLTSEICSYLAQVKVKVRSKRSQTKILKWVVWRFHGPFWTKNSIVDSHSYFIIDLIWTQKYEIQFMIRLKISKRSNFHFLQQSQISDAESPQQSNGTISFPVRWVEL